jgi:hypothetical protein
MLELLPHIARGLIRNQTARRHMMFYVIILAMVMLFAGGTFLKGILFEHPLFLVAFWFLCGALTILAALLAVFDILVLRAQARAERKRLEREVLEAARQRERRGAE